MLAAVERQPFFWHGQTYHVSASVGMVKFDKTTPSYEALIGEADMAMFAAKRSGRNQVALFQQEHGGAVLQEMEVLAQLRSALEQDRFELHAQPIVPVRNIAHKTHFEVLVRMRAANGALVSPAAFIPTAEKYGMMDKLDRWVIQHVLQTYAAYPRLGDLHFAINLSAQSLSDPALWPFVSQQFRSTSVPPHTITFEVTETGIIENMETANSFLRQVRGLGCAVALDDFGTGLSSLSYLKMFTLDYLKIDGSFIRELRQNPLDQSIVRATSQIAHTMQASTVGECAEDLETIELLAELGVDCVQGWAAGRPVLLQTTLEQHAATAALAGTQDRHPADEHATASLAATGRLALA